MNQFIYPETLVDVTPRKDELPFLTIKVIGSRSASHRETGLKILERMQGMRNSLCLHVAQTDVRTDRNTDTQMV